jgi:Cu/Ag efflux pump CusA
MGVPFTILSFFGVIGLSGIVVNDSLVLMNTLKNKLSQGCNVYESTIEAGQLRLRAIVSTTITTVAGLTPLLLERSLQAQFLIPMAISIAFGVLFATVITLVLLPSMFLLFNDLHRFWRWLWTGIWPSREDVEAECQRNSHEQEATHPTAPPSTPSPSSASSA